MMEESEYIFGISLKIDSESLRPVPAFPIIPNS